MSTILIAGIGQNLPLDGGNKNNDKVDINAAGMVKLVFRLRTCSIYI